MSIEVWDIIIYTSYRNNKVVRRLWQPCHQVVADGCNNLVTTAGKNLGFEIVTTLLQGCTQIVKLLCIHNVLSDTSTLHSSDHYKLYNEIEQNQYKYILQNIEDNCYHMQIIKMRHVVNTAQN